MGIRERRIIRSVHPWLGVRLEWLSEVAAIVGSAQSLISGNRTREEQRVLFDRQGDRPAAAPGCSQHQYGFAADAVYRRATNITSKARGLLSTQAETDRFMQSAAHHVGLTTVNNDPGHLQIYPWAQFRDWAIRFGSCSPISKSGWNIIEVQASNDRWSDCLSRATLRNRQGFRETTSCALPCGPLFNIPC